MFIKLDEELTRKQKRRLKRYVKFMKKDISKSFDIPEKMLFGKKAPQSSACIAIEAMKKIELERIKKTREVFTELIKEKIEFEKDWKLIWE